jgi:hypothetical protein
MPDQNRKSEVKMIHCGFELGIVLWFDEIGNCPRRKLCKCFIVWSEQREWPCTLESIDEASGCHS